MALQRRRGNLRRDEMKVPVKFVGGGETMEDLQVFEPISFVDALFQRGKDA